MPTAIITGCAKRIGRLIALHLARHGWDITIHYNKSADYATSLYKEISEIGSTPYLAQLDFEEQDCDFGTLFNLAKEPVTLLINNASVFINDNVSNLTYHRIDAHMKVNLIAPMLLTQKFAQQNFKEYDNINIINILDSHAQRMPLNFCTYYTSKLALANFTQIAAKQLAPKIRVNAIALGYVMKNQLQDQNKFDLIVNNSLLGDVVPFNEIYAAIDFIIQTHSITGEILNLGK